MEDFRTNLRGPFSTERAGYLLLALTAFLLPFFFVPSRFVTIEISKAIFLVIGIIGAFLLFLLNVVKHGEIEIFRHKLLWGVLAVPIVFLISSILAPNPSFSLFGYGLETGSFAFVALGFLFLFLSTVFLRTRERIFGSFMAFLVGLILVLIIALSKLFIGENALSFGVITGVVGNPVGSWTDLAVFLGISSVMIVVALETVPFKNIFKALFFGLLVLSLFVLTVLNFSMVWLLLLIFSLIFFVYLASASKINSEGKIERKISYASLLLLIVSLLFFFNPSISGKGKIGEVMAGYFNVSNIEIR